KYLSKEVGARYLITRGVIADYALVAEGTDFNVTWTVAGKACFKISVYGKSVYVPFMPPRTELSASPNAIIKMAAVLTALEEWRGSVRARQFAGYARRPASSQSQRGRDSGW